MKIISSFKDFYDVGMRYGQDETVQYVRTPHNVDVRLTPFDAKSPRSTWSLVDYAEGNVCGPAGEFGGHNGEPCWLASITVLFAGKLYRGIRLSFADQDKYFWTHEALIEYAKEHKLTDDAFQAPENKKSKYGYWRYPIAYRLKSWFSKQGSEYLKQKAIEDNIVIMVATHVGTTTPKVNSNVEIEEDCSLRKLEFYKVLDTNTAYQELDMFVSGMLAGSGRPTTDIPDEYKIKEHGFDKWSFRKMPTGKNHE